MTYVANNQKQITFYIDHQTGAVKEETDTDENTLTASTWVYHAFSSIITPNGDTLDNYKVLRVMPEYYNATADTWDVTSESGVALVYTTGNVSYCIEAGIYDDNGIYVTRGNNSTFYTGPAGGSTGSTVGRVTNHPVRIKITALKTK